MIAKWIIIGWIALGALMTIANIGKPRKPLEPGQVAVMSLINAAFITAVIIWGH